MGLSSGDVLQNRYRIVSLLGQGGMGAVYRAWDTRLDVPVAFKEMTPQPGLDPYTLTQLRQQFAQEATVLAQLKHPRLVSVSDFFEEGGNVYLVMDFVEGENLADRIARLGALPEGQVLTWADQLLDALSYCHSRGVIHRDVKPQNVIIRPDGQAVLVDFGLVKLWDPNDPHTRTAMRGMGTLEYAPPEQYGVQPGHTEPRSDVYGVGSTLYHALTGRAPLAAGDRRAAPDRFVPPRGLNPRVGPSTEAAVLRAMELERAKRFQSTQEMAAALRSGTYVPVPPAVRPRLAVPGWAWVAGAVAVVVLAVAAATTAVVVSLSGGGGSTPVPRTLMLLETAVPVTPVEGPTPVSIPVLRPSTAILPENVDRVAELARWGKGTANGVAYSPDGRSLAVASSLGIYLYDAETLEEKRFVEAGGWVNGVAFSPDGATLAAGSKYGGVYLWRVSDGALLSTLRDEGHSCLVLSVAFSPDGSMLASGGATLIEGYCGVQVWRIPDGTLLHELEGGGFSLAFSPDGSTLASGNRLWRVSDGKLLRTLEEGGDIVAFSPDGQVLASAAGREVQLWQVSDGRLLRAMGGHVGSVLGLVFSPDGSILASASVDDTVRLWRVSDGALLRTLEGHAGDVTGVASSFDGRALASASSDGTVRLWRVSDGALLGVLQDYTRWVGGVVTSAAGDNLLWNWPRWVSSVAYSPDGATLALEQPGGTVELWSAADGTLLRTLEGAGTVLAFSPGGVTLASRSGQEVQLWNVADGALLRALEVPDARTFSPDWEMLASGSDDGAVQLWRVSDGSLVRTLEGGDSVVAFSPDGGMVVAASDNGTVRLWQVSDGTLLRTLEGHAGDVTGVVFSPDGATLAVGARVAGGVQLWRVSDGVLLHTLEEPGWAGAWSMAFSPDGTMLAVGVGWSSGRVQLWQVSDGSLLRALEGHTAHVDSVAFSPDGTILASASEDGTVRFWGVVEE